MTHHIETWSVDHLGGNCKWYEWYYINYKARHRTQGNWKGGGFSMNNGKLIWKQEILFISFRFSCRQGPCLSTLLQEAGPGSDEKNLFNNNPRPLLCLPLHCFPFLFLPINFCLISNETGQKVIITADPTRVKNVIIKLGRGRPSASMTSHTTEEGNGNPVLIIHNERRIFNWFEIVSFITLTFRI